jgi:hypothetical protein
VISVFLLFLQATILDFSTSLIVNAQGVSVQTCLVILSVVEG